MLPVRLLHWDSILIRMKNRLYLYMRILPYASKMIQPLHIEVVKDTLFIFL